MKKDLYACADLDSTASVYQACKEWVLIDNPEPMIPHLTMQEWNELSVAIALCLVLAWGIRIIGSLI